MSGKNMIVPEGVIEDAVDKYLEGIFGREVVWEDFNLPKYTIRVEEFFSPPHHIDFEYYGVEDEW